MHRYLVHSKLELKRGAEKQTGTEEGHPQLTTGTFVETPRAQVRPKGKKKKLFSALHVTGVTYLPR